MLSSKSTLASPSVSTHRSQPRVEDRETLTMTPTQADVVSPAHSPWVSMCGYQGTEALKSLQLWAVPDLVPGLAYISRQAPPGMSTDDVEYQVCRTRYVPLHQVCRTNLDTSFFLLKSPSPSHSDEAILYAMLSTLPTQNAVGLQ